jgi:hypothetical protein
MSSGYLSELLIEVNFVFSLLPSPFTAAMIASEMPAAISPYSMAVAPVSPARNSRKIFIGEIWTGNSNERLTQVVGFAPQKFSRCYDGTMRFGTSGIEVPALTFSASATFCLANAFASVSLRNVSVARAKGRLAGGAFLHFKETYQVFWRIAAMGFAVSFLLKLVTDNLSSCRKSVRNPAGWTGGNAREY